MSVIDRLDALREVLDILPVGVWLMDAQGKILYGNPAGRRIWGGARYVGVDQFGEYRGWWVPSGKRIEAHEWAAARAIRDGETSIDEEIEIECFDGGRKIILNSSMPIRREDGRIEGALIVNLDITQRRQAEDRLREMAERDPLTNAYNRRHLYEFMTAEIQRSRRYGSPLSVLMFDIDHFKRINDEHGHETGDRVLVRLVELVNQALRGADQLARYGGEEFIVVAPGIGLAQAVVLAERLRLQIERTPFDPVSRLTCSFGVCELGEGGVDALLRRVDEWLYQAKRAGRNQVAAG
jgi:diguanylate cyclase (GGDEF)-like protein/PAS domain S-box-containing protein